MIHVEPDFRTGMWQFRAELGSFTGGFSFAPYLKRVPLSETVALAPERVFLEDSVTLKVPMTAEYARRVSADLKAMGFRVEGSSEARVLFGLLASVPSDGSFWKLMGELPKDLFFHQKLAICFALDRDRAFAGNVGFFLDMGLGKTRATLEVVLRRGGPTLVLAPSFVVPGWRDEARRWTPSLCPLLMTGTRQEKIAALNHALALKASFPVLLITNYETLLDDGFFKEFKKFGFRTLVCDESLWVKNPSAQRSRRAYQLSKVIPSRMLLTGTPISQSVEDIYSQYRVLDDRIFGTHLGAFRERYCEIEQRMMGGNVFREVVGQKNVPELRKKMYSCAIQFTKAQCLDLPEKRYMTRMVELTSEQRRAYDSLSKAFLAMVQGEMIEAMGALPQMVKLAQVASGFAYAQDGSLVRFRENPKLDSLMDFLSGLPVDEKAVIWGTFHGELDWIAESLKETFGNGCVVILDGRLPQSERETAIQAFQMGGTVRFAVCQIAAVSSGVNLHRAATACYFSNPWSYALRIQSEDRIHRIGQKASCLYVDFIASETMDEAHREALFQKADLSRRITRRQWERLVQGRWEEKE